ncbi:MAG: hypothetical protein ACUVXA_18955 [Candidatus Jordarchaeum sp.]|uniref:hypothetical protein n=1 Tax=Candidatus Jordarchaeum sp. TaxID=2823881 RepID=UPI00404A1F3B
MHKIEKEKLRKPPRLVGRLTVSIIIAGAISLIPIILASYFMVNYLDLPLYVLIGLTPLYYISTKWVFNLTFLVLVRVQLKPVEEGSHEVDMRNKNVRNWMINVMLTNSASHFMGNPPLGQTLFNTFVYKFLKCKMGPGATAHRISDPYLVEMGTSSVGGAGTLMVPHISEGNRLYLRKIKIGDGAVVGVNTLVFPGAEIGEGAVIGAYSFVPRDTKIPPNTVWAGVPVKQISPKPSK